ncbi:MAG: hypothetical protein QOI26_2510, partial [Pseudonocardiales bacterium]|nr:hypothetical protein [Pseudonocardiales bacterium]
DDDRTLVMIQRQPLAAGRFGAGQPAQWHSAHRSSRTAVSAGSS